MRCTTVSPRGTLDRRQTGPVESHATRDHLLSDRMDLYRLTQATGPGSGGSAMPDATTATDSNPLRQALPRTRVPEPCAVVLFGATGDLTHRKLVPALYHLARGGQPAGRVRHRRLRPPRLDRRPVPRRAREDASPRTAAPTSTSSGPSSPAASSSPPGTFDDPRRYAQLKEQARGARPHARHARQPALLPGRRPRVLRDDHRPARRGRA